MRSLGRILIFTRTLKKSYLEGVTLFFWMGHKWSVEAEFKECGVDVDCRNISMPVIHTTMKTPSSSFIQEGDFSIPEINGHAHQNCSIHSSFQFKKRIMDRHKLVLKPVQKIEWYEYRETDFLYKIHPLFDLVSSSLWVLEKPAYQFGNWWAG